MTISRDDYDVIYGAPHMLKADEAPPIDGIGEPPILSRDDLLVSARIKKDIPARDYLLGSLMCTTPRWFISAKPA
jgi:hypothetical protein